ncbi:MAG: divalent metal cation transporter MntH, partial [Actinomycetota bacterium]
MTTGTSNRSRLNLKGLFGPALVAGVAYIDPGNIATNLTAGSRYGYMLIWVLVLATVSAALFQFLSAK